jgi:ketosteroid isomerase-like protein
MDTAAVLQEIYRCYREKRLADIVDLLSDDFKFTALLPEDALSRSRSRAETALLTHKFMEQYDVLAFEPGPITVADGVASAEATARFRHKKTGKVLDTTFVHNWRVANGKAFELEQTHDVEALKAFLESIGESAA